jgi:putative FmdB family regulatory protein
MPIHDYHCDHCGHTFSAVQSYTDATLEKCPSCGKRPRKLMATPAIVFKGGGWYKTDSRPAQKDGGGSKTESGSERKPDGKTDRTSDPSKEATPAKADTAKADTAKADAPVKTAPKGDAASS